MTVLIGVCLIKDFFEYVGGGGEFKSNEKKYIICFKINLLYFILDSYSVILDIYDPVCVLLMKHDHIWQNES